MTDPKQVLANLQSVAKAQSALVQTMPSLREQVQALAAQAKKQTDQSLKQITDGLSVYAANLQKFSDAHSGLLAAIADLHEKGNVGPSTADVIALVQQLADTDRRRQLDLATAQQAQSAAEASAKSAHEEKDAAHAQVRTLTDQLRQMTSARDKLQSEIDNNPANEAVKARRLAQLQAQRDAAQAEIDRMNPLVP
jgi:chromosome segregation ATPase